MLTNIYIYDQCDQNRSTADLSGECDKHSNSSFRFWLAFSATTGTPLTPKEKKYDPHVQESVSITRNTSWSNQRHGEQPDGQQMVMASYLSFLPIHPTQHNPRYHESTVVHVHNYQIGHFFKTRPCGMHNIEVQAGSCRISRQASKVLKLSQHGDGIYTKGEWSFHNLATELSQPSNWSLNRVMELLWGLNANYTIEWLSGYSSELYFT